MLKQCATTVITAVRAASTMLAMGEMLGRLVVQLKMPRLDAYRTSFADGEDVTGSRRGGTTIADVGMRVQLATLKSP